MPVEIAGNATVVAPIRRRPGVIEASFMSF